MLAKCECRHWLTEAETLPTLITVRFPNTMFVCAMAPSVAGHGIGVLTWTSV